MYHKKYSMICGLRGTYNRGARKMHIVSLNFETKAKTIRILRFANDIPSFIASNKDELEKSLQRNGT